MKTIELSAAIASAPVQENLKNFAGLDAQNALGLMTPERLAAVAGVLSHKEMTAGMVTKLENLETGSCYFSSKSDIWRAIEDRPINSEVPDSLLFGEGSILTIGDPKYREQIIISNKSATIYVRWETNSVFSEWRKLNPTTM